MDTGPQLTGRPPLLGPTPLCPQGKWKARCGTNSSKTRETGRRATEMWRLKTGETGTEKSGFLFLFWFTLFSRFPSERCLRASPHRAGIRGLGAENKPCRAPPPRSIPPPHPHTVFILSTERTVFGRLCPERLTRFPCGLHGLHVKGHTWKKAYSTEQPTRRTLGVRMVRGQPGDEDLRDGQGLLACCPRSRLNTRCP